MPLFQCRNPIRLYNGFVPAPGTCFTVPVVFLRVIAHPYFPSPQPCTVKNLLQQQQQRHDLRTWGKQITPGRCEELPIRRKLWSGCVAMESSYMDSTAPMLGKNNYKNYDRAVKEEGHL